mmetsp:Transcript_28858/g.50782  ORF Transcript_28858/g.50782 Transcript_28858/m.50782 type:complete len:222 (+) Transcript_28858:78-743(+)
MGTCSLSICVQHASLPTRPITGIPLRLNVSNSAIEYPALPSPHTSHTCASGCTSFAPSANPAPTPRVPYAPGSSQLSGPRGLRMYDAVATKSPPSATRMLFSGSSSSSLKNKSKGLTNGVFFLSPLPKACLFALVLLRASTALSSAFSSFAHIENLFLQPTTLLSASNFLHSETRNMLGSDWLCTLAFQNPKLPSLRFSCSLLRFTATMPTPFLFFIRCLP